MLLKINMTHTRTLVKIDRFKWDDDFWVVDPWDIKMYRKKVICDDWFPPDNGFIILPHYECTLYDCEICQNE